MVFAAAPSIPSASQAFRSTLKLIDAYEIGLKSEWLENRLRLNGAAFYYDFTDLQVVISRGSSTDLLNAGKAEIKGLELEMKASVRTT